MADPLPHPVVLVGLHGGSWFGAAAGHAVMDADVVIGAPRHLVGLSSAGDVTGCRIPLEGSVIELLDEAHVRALRGQRVTVLTSGDPGFFGLGRLAARRFGASNVVVHPAPSAVSLAFSRLGEHWDDARVVSAHGRPLDVAVEAITAHGPGDHKVAVLASPEHSPQVIGAALLTRSCAERRVAVCSRLATPEEEVTETDLAGLAAGSWDPLSVVIIRAPRTGVASEMAPTLSWGASEDTYAHRAGMITKAEVRAVALGKLTIPATGVLWDVGAGSGSLSAEVAALSPGIDVFAIERNPVDVSRVRSNLETRGLIDAVTVVEGVAPEVFADLPDPDRIFVGGGGIGVLDAALSRLRPRGVVVATYAAMERALQAEQRLGNLVQLAVSRGVQVGGVPVGAVGGLRLQAENPVFICWGSP